eukprot:1715561-Pleurochrysis_carterae.AAC.1
MTEQLPTLCVSGPKLVRILRLGERDSQLKPSHPSFGTKGAEAPNVTDHCWLSDDTIAACTDTADVCVFDRLELRHTISTPAPLGVPSAMHKLLCIAAFSRGLIVGGTGGALCIYERNLNRHGYSLKHSLSCIAPDSGLPPQQLLRQQSSAPQMQTCERANQGEGTHGCRSAGARMG